MVLSRDGGGACDLVCMGLPVDPAKLSFGHLTVKSVMALKKNEMLSFAGKWMELENIILSEVSLAQKTKHRMFSLICGH
jgi:hypothetical protein